MIKKVIIALILLVLIPSNVLAWEDCLQNKVDCKSPGECSKYIDTDGDEICDHSQPAPEDRIDNMVIATAELDSDTKISETVEKTDIQPRTMYHLLPITLLLIISYFATLTLSKKKILSVVNHRKIWNILLLISFLISGILGILLIIRINFGKTHAMPFNALFWHVEIGIAMFVISIIHIVERWNYFKNLLKLKK